MSRSGTFDVLVWAEQQRCGGPGPKAVLLALARISGLKEDGTWSCWPGVKLLAEITEQSDRTVRTQLASMEAAGLISRKRRTRPMGDGRGRTTDRITLAFQQAGFADYSEGDLAAEPPRPSGKSGATQRQPVAAQNYRTTTRELGADQSESVDNSGDEEVPESWSVPVDFGAIRAQVRGKKAVS